MFFAIKTLQQETSYAIMPKDNWHVRRITKKKVKTLSNSTLKNTMKKGGCGECQTSCQSACKTSCTVGNQSCENANR